MDHGTAEDGSAGDRLWVRSPRIEPLQKCATLWWEVATCDEVLTLAIKPVRVGPCTITEAYGTVDDCVENWLHISRGLADHGQDFRRRRLLVQRLGDLCMGRCEGAILLLQLGEQSNILDGDHGLVGEGLHKGDLPVGERLDLRPPDRHSSE